MPHSLAALLLCLSLVAAAAEPPVSATPAAIEAAPPLREARVMGREDLGTWDDVFVMREQATLLLRDGTDLYALSATAGTPQAIASRPDLAGTKVIACVDAGERRWVFLYSELRTPFAVDVRSGLVAEFGIPPLPYTDHHFPWLGPVLVSPLAGTALITIGGPEIDSWVLPHNWPIYFWLDLATGRTRAIPIGWNPCWFSADLETAVFSVPSATSAGPLPYLQVPLDTRTCEPLAEIPDFTQVDGIEATNDIADVLLPMYRRRAGLPEHDFLTGLTWHGTSISLTIPGSDDSYLRTAVGNDQALAFYLQPKDMSYVLASPLWIVDLTRGRQLHRIAEAAVDFTLLDHGSCLFVTVADKFELDKSKSFSEVWYCRADGKGRWNLMEGIERLPPLKVPIAEKSDVKDYSEANLYPGLGAQAQVALCIFSQYQEDRRASKQFVESRSHHDVMLVGAAGERYHTDLFRGDGFANMILPVTTSRVLTGTYESDPTMKPVTRRTHLRAITLEATPSGK